jgi:tripartite-type tricarboxylate transporter receptor subunit TctC
VHHRFAATLGATAVLAIAAASAPHAAPADVEAFYKGKTLEIYSGSEPGSGYDGYARIIARHIGRFVPGHPATVVKNMPAASGLAETNFLYNQAARDGTVFGIITNNMTVEPLIGNKNARFEPQRMSWIGGASKLVNVCVTWHALPLRTAEDLRSREWLTGGTAARSSTVQQANVFIVLGGAKLKVVRGYPSTTSMILALERGELEIACGIGWDSVKSSTSYQREGKIVPIMQLSYQKHPELMDVPFIYDMLTDPGAKPIVDFITQRLDIGRAFAGPPDIPEERLQALRDAFWAAVNDPEFKADADRQNMEILPARGEETQKMVVALTQTSPEIISLTDKVLENQINVSEVKLIWKSVKDAKVTGLEGDGLLVFTAAGQTQRADASKAKVSVAGKEAKLADVKVGAVCEVSYLGNNDLAREIACQGAAP